MTAQSGNMTARKGVRQLNAKLTQRMPEDLHQRLLKLSENYGVSLNTLINMACEEFEKTGRLDELERRIEELENQIKK
jgi:hypothetical protein